MIRKFKKTRLQFHHDVNVSFHDVKKCSFWNCEIKTTLIIYSCIDSTTPGIGYPDKSCSKVVNMDGCIHNFDIVICSNDLKVAVDFFIFCCVQSNKILYIHNHNLQYIPDKDISVIGLALGPLFLKVNSLHRLLILLSLIMFVLFLLFCVFYQGRSCLKN